MRQYREFISKEEGYGGYKLTASILPDLAEPPDISK